MGTADDSSTGVGGIEVAGAPTAAGRETKEGKPGDCGGLRISKPRFFHLHLHV